MPTWGDLFDRADARDGVTVESIRERLAERRERRAEDSGAGSDEPIPDEPEDGDE